MARVATRQRACISSGALCWQPVCAAFSDAHVRIPGWIRNDTKISKYPMRGCLSEIWGLLLNVLEATPACDPSYFCRHLIIHLSLEEGRLLAWKELVPFNLTAQKKSFFTYKTRYPPILLLATDRNWGQAQRGERLFLLCFSWKALSLLKNN